ncbi:GTPase [Actinobaculum massiliense]|uniref:G domain-containing protein n=1 Tax=Actinobaculum massiliense ACS-171-V-Col2 TaxID=883066 RepID=K9EFD3_9ACTO|nr:GTPase [Actinobaculum massiliense]EKU95919.1 hypothetical protein HMPREF9233_00007 [Actinobaculum massiliense ACS-171-V-Col2]MDK8566619.1 50S ribosome-binding GTPase [Actinobaculum massiliense]
MALNLPDGLAYLSRALELGGRHLDPAVRHDAEAILEKARERGRVGAARTVVAFAGPTGSGKSSLVNAVVGQRVVKTAATRPATSEAIGVSGRHASDVLDWLGVRNRKVVMQLSSAELADLVLIDLPDIDSTRLEHREIADGVIARADVLVWVVDPQKYADAVLHEDYLRPLAENSGSILVVLNQVDRLTNADARAIANDLERMLRADHISADVLLVSAARGDGIEALRARLAATAQTRRAAAERLAGDVRGAGSSIAADIAAQGGTIPTDQPVDGKPVASAIARAAGARDVARAAGASYAHRAALRTGWPLVSWARRRVRDPLERIGLGRVFSSDDGGVPSSAVAPADAQRAQTELQRYADELCVDMPRRWRSSVRERVAGSADDLADFADRIVTTTDTEYRRTPLWWRLVALLQWIGAAAFVVGAVWVLARMAAPWLGFELGGSPRLGRIPWPTVLLAGGALWGVVVSAAARIARTRGAARTEERVRERIVERVKAETDGAFFAPLHAERKNYAEFAAAVKALANVSA